MSGQGGDDPGGFLSRWSRLKREKETTKPTDQAATESPPMLDEQGEADAPFDPDRLAIPLPSLDDLKPGDTLVAFMQKGVPDAIRNAALRKMWALDPMVRDFRSEALDYAWDWNAPGGIPGGGPLGVADRAEEMAEALFRSQPANDDTASPETEPPVSPPIAEVAQETTIAPVDPAEPAADGAAAGGVGAEPAGAKTEISGPKRRHGGAMPQVFPVSTPN